MKELAFRRLVKPEDMNPANRLFGGRMMEWADEAAALYAMMMLESKSIVTLKVSEIVFTNPALCGDILEFRAGVKLAGNTSLTVELEVEKIILLNEPQPSIQNMPYKQILKCEFVFVHVDGNGKPSPHHFGQQNK